MQPETVVAWIVTFAVICFALVRSIRGQVFVPIADPPSGGGTKMPDEDEQQPETDLAPASAGRFPSLMVAVAATAALRIGLLVAMHR